MKKGTTAVTMAKWAQRTSNGPVYKKFFVKDEMELKKEMNHYWKQSRCLRTALMNRDLREHLNEFLNITLGSVINLAMSE